MYFITHSGLRLLNILGLFPVTFSEKFNIFYKSPKKLCFIIIQLISILLISSFALYYFLVDVTKHPRLILVYYYIFILYSILLFIEIWRQIFTIDELVDILNISCKLTSKIRKAIPFDKLKFEKYFKKGIFHIILMILFILPGVFIASNCVSRYYQNPYEYWPTIVLLICYSWYHAFICPLLLLYWMNENNFLIIEQKIIHLTNEINNSDLIDSDICEFIRDIDEITVIYYETCKIVEKITKHYTFILVSVFGTNFSRFLWQLFAAIWVAILIIDGHLSTDFVYIMNIFTNIITSLIFILIMSKRAHCLTEYQKSCALALHDIHVKRFDYELKKDVS